MPRVTAAHRAARYDQVLDAGLRCFAANGFHATSMADVIAESGLSAGAVYLYVRSKEDLIVAVAERVLGRAVEGFDRWLRDPSIGPADAVGSAVTLIETVATETDVDVTRVAVQAWAEAQRNERIATAASRVYRTIRSRFVDIAAREQAAGRLDPAADPQVVGQALFSLVLGYLLQRLLIGDVERHAYTEAVRALLGR